VDRDRGGAGVTVHLHIDRLLLDGVMPGQGGVEELQEALRSHLAELLVQPALSRGTPAQAPTLGEQAAVAVRDALPARLPGVRA